MADVSRRNIIAAGATAFAAASYSRIMGANERIRVAVIGCGSRGNGQIRTFLNIPDLEAVGVCDLYGRKLEAAKKRVPQAEEFSDHRKLLEIKNLDAVSISTPDHWHVPIAIEALSAGKDVYCEKPLTLKIEEGPSLIKAVHQTNRVFQT